jgi:2-polyprenyl-6-methoxyphenol hydroxylase-like FAD-dependent oxidoreductase
MTLDALVVGAGPVGLTMAAELERHGLSCRIVDMNEGPSLWSKAQVIHARTLEVLDDAGLVAPILQRGRPITGVSFFSPTMERVGGFPIGDIDSHYPYLMSLSQRETEIALAEGLVSRGVRIERKTRLESFVQDESGVTATIARDDGETEEVRAAHLIGCDGSHSAVRKGLGLPFEGSTYPVRIIQADVRIDLPVPLADEFGIFLGPKGMLALFPLPGDRRFRMLTFLEPSEPDYALPVELSSFMHVMAERGPAGAVVSDPAWMIDFRIHCRLAPRYRQGRVFLTGDAAHIHSPAGGQGMNMGIQDAYNLAWKLGLAQRGKAKEILLDSYEAERRPVAETTLRATDAATKGLQAMLGLKSAVAVELRNHILGVVTSLGFVRTRATRTVSMLEVGYPKSPIVAQDQPPLWSVRLVGGQEERPSLGDWMHFGDGPAPGLRTPDVPFGPGAPRSTRRPFAPSGEPRSTRNPQGGGGGPDRLHDVLRGTHHTLLLFDGPQQTGGGYERFARITETARTRAGDLIRTFVVVPGGERPEGLALEASVLFDPEGELHRRFGARSECLYLVRPDGYVGYRCQPADEHRFAAYLERIFTDARA